jgi:AcrR family transcriptional regulator
MQVHPKHLPSEERRAATVEAVVALAGEQHPSEISTSAIARRMGVTQGALFKHFPSKEAILQAVMDWVAEHLLRRLESAANEAPDVAGRLEAMFFAHVEFVREHPGVPRMIFGELQRAESSLPKLAVQNLIRKYSAKLEALLVAGKEAGEFHAELDTTAAAILFIGTIQGLVMQSLLAGDLRFVRRDAPRVFAIYLRGLRSRP